MENRCGRCNYCKESNILYKSFHCEHPDLETDRIISVDKLPKKHLIWCPFNEIDED